MTEEPRPPRRRPRGRRRGGQARPQQARGEGPPFSEPSARPEPQRPSGGRAGDRPRERGGTRGRGGAPRPDRALAARDTFGRERRSRRGGRGRGPRSADEIRPGTPCVILLDAREGEPDRSGSAAVFEGFFDFESGEPRRPGHGIPRLRIGDERLWGFECWWRVDTDRAGLTDTDREDVESSKRLLRGLLRDARRSTARVAR